MQVCRSSLCDLKVIVITLFNILVVKADLANTWPLLRTGAIMIGHDFAHYSQGIAHKIVKHVFLTTYFV